MSYVSQYPGCFKLEIHTNVRMSASGREEGREGGKNEEQIKGGRDKRGVEGGKDG